MRVVRRSRATTRSPTIWPPGSMGGVWLSSSPSLFTSDLVTVVGSENNEEDGGLGFQFLAF